MKIINSTLFGLAVGAACQLSSLAAPATNQLPPFSEVYDLIRSNAPGIKESDLQRAAVLGLLHQLSNQVTLVDSSTTAADGTHSSPLIAKSEIYNNDFGYLRIGAVNEGLQADFRKAFDLLKTGKKLQGLVLDLRFADGKDYNQAGKTADLFLSDERILFRRADDVIRSTAKTNAIALPLVLLVNSDTSGAAEVLAAILHDNKIGLVIGSPPKKHARAYKEIPLATGQKLRIATTEISVGSQPEAAEKAVEPDLTLQITPEAERSYFNNPYALSPLAGLAATNSNAATNLFPRRRMNEAELVRMQREGLSLDAETAVAEKPSEQKPVLTDPALARALDILKGLAVVQNRF